MSTRARCRYTGDWVADIVRNNQPQPVEFAVVSNPEFLREGSAILDFMNPDRVVLGSLNREEANRVAQLYLSFPVPTAVPLGAKKGKAILVSGHDLKDLAGLLEQTQGKGINIYTHGEMLPSHGYPGLKKYGHLAGHYGTAWQNQAKEFAEFPGAILMTRNCIQPPQPAYKDNIFTTGLVGWPDVAHVPGRDFAPVIRRALELPGFIPQGTSGGSEPGGRCRGSSFL